MKKITVIGFLIIFLLTASSCGTEKIMRFDDVMGYSGYVTEEEPGNSWHNYLYIACLSDGSERVIAESFGFDEAGESDFPVDIDGDGVKELVCNVCYGGDGARRVFVYKRQGDEILVGSPCWEKIPDDYDDWGVNSFGVEYDAQEDAFCITYSLKDNDDEHGMVKVKGIENITFDKYVYRGID